MLAVGFSVLILLITQLLVEYYFYYRLRKKKCWKTNEEYREKIRQLQEDYYKLEKRYVCCKQGRMDEMKKMEKIETDGW